MKISLLQNSRPSPEADKVYKVADYFKKCNNQQLYMYLILSLLLMPLTCI